MYWNLKKEMFMPMPMGKGYIIDNKGVSVIK